MTKIRKQSYPSLSRYKLINKSIFLFLENHNLNNPLENLHMIKSV